jgi:hypothetical protein
LAVTLMQPVPPAALKASAVWSSPESWMKSAPQARLVCSGRARFADDVLVLRQPRHGLDRHVDHAARGDVVDEHRDVGGIGDRREMQEHPFLRRLVVVRRDHKDRIGAGGLGMAGEVDRLGGGIAARAGDHRHAAGGGLDAQLHHALVFGMGQGRAFPGGADRHQGFRALGDLPLDQVLEGFVVHGSVGTHRRDQRDHRTPEHSSFLRHSRL